MRAVGERLKAEIYLYLTRTPPYGSDPHRLLGAKVQSITSSVSDLLGETVGVTPSPRSPPPVHDMSSYVQHRVRGQITAYYRPQGAEAQKRMQRARNCVFALALLGAALGGVASAVGSDSAATSISAWVAVTTTLSGAVAAHAASAHYQQNAITYLQTARQLEQLVNEWEDQAAAGAGSPDADVQLVQLCEDVISTENQSWVGRWNIADNK